MEIKTLKILTIVKISTFLIGLSAFCVAGFLFNLVIGVIITGIVLIAIALILQFEIGLVTQEIKESRKGLK